MTQLAPYPALLEELVGQLRYKDAEGWRLSLRDMVRDKGPDGEVLSQGLTLVVTRVGPDTYDPDSIIAVNHYFPVPPATYNRRSWMWWVYKRLGDVEDHERAENFKVGGEVVYPPAHGPGNDPYLVLHYGSAADAETDFRGRRNEGSQPHLQPGVDR